MTLETEYKKRVKKAWEFLRSAPERGWPDYYQTAEERREKALARLEEKKIRKPKEPEIPEIEQPEVELPKEYISEELVQLLKEEPDYLTKKIVTRDLWISPEQARELGIETLEDLRIPPSPKGEEIAIEYFGEEAPTPIEELPYTEEQLAEVDRYITEEPERFLAEATESGRTSELDNILRQLYGASEEELEEIFGAFPEREVQYPEGTFILSDYQRAEVLRSGGVPEDEISKVVSMSHDPNTYVTDTGAYVPESAIKDAWDALVMGAVNIAHRTYQYFTSTLPNALFADVKEGQPLGPGIFQTYTKEEAERTNEYNKNMRDVFRREHFKAQIGYESFVKKHPELKPKPEYQLNPFENPELFKDPGWWLYTMSDTAAFTIGVVGATTTTFFITRNPYLALGAGVAVATPAQSQDVYEDLLAAGAPEDEAARIAMPVGFLISNIEVVTDLPLLKAIAPGFQIVKKELQKSVINNTITNFIKKGVLTAGKIELAEVIDETSQQAIQNTFVGLYDENREVFEGFDETVIKTLVATLPFAIFGAGTTMYHVSQDIARDTPEDQRVGWEQDDKTGEWYQPVKMTEIYDDAVEQGKESGLTDDQAKLHALNEVARTPDGEVAIRDYVSKAEEVRPEIAEKIAQITRDRETGKITSEEASRRIAELRGLEIPEVAEEVKPEVAMPAIEPISVEEASQSANELINEFVKEEAELAETTDVVSKLTQLIDKAEPARNATEKLKHEELSQRAGRAAAILRSGEGREAFERSTSALKGELPKADFAPPELQLTDVDIKDLYNTIRDSEIRYFDKLNTAKALGKLLSGNIPTRGDIQLLENMFGEKLAKTILSKRTLGTRVWENMLDLLNLPRAVMASWDLSAPLRQGAVLFWGQPKQSLPAFVPMLKAFASEKSTVMIDEIIKGGKYAELRQDAGLYQGPLWGVSAKLSEREESFMSRLAQYVPLVRRSERAYIIYLNKLRADVFDSYARAWEGTNKTMKDYQELAKFINRATGRGELGKLSNSAPILSAIFFSPRYQASRIMLPVSFFTATPVVRKVIARNIVAFVASNFVILSLLKLAGANIDDDPRSADFGKGKIGNTRLDFWAGFQQYARAVTQIMTGMRKVSTTGKLTEGERIKIIADFARSKLSPVAGLALDIIEGETFLGEELSIAPEDVKQQAYSRLTPMFVQDLIEAVDESGITGGFMALPGMFGVGVQTYGGGYWDEFINQLGQPKLNDTLPYSSNLADIYTTKDLWGDALYRIRGIPLEDMDEQYGYPLMIKIIAEARDIKEEYENRPSSPLIQINSEIKEGDTFENYYLQWREYLKAESDQERAEVAKKYPKYYMGNFTQRELSLLREYHRIGDEYKDAFIEEHPEIKVNPKDEWLKENPEENARLALWGQAKIHSIEAYNDFQRLLDDLDIPDSAVPDFTTKVKEEVFKDYLEYSEITKPADYDDKLGWYEDDWFLMEHSELYQEMIDAGEWGERDFSKVPTREVFSLWTDYQNVPTGKARLVFRHEHPELDSWLVGAKGYTPVGDRWQED